MKLARYGWIAPASLAAGLGILALVVAREHPVGSFAGTSTLGGIAELAAGWSLVAAGLLFRARHRTNRFGILLVAAGLAWFLPELSNPRVGVAFGFTVGLVGFVACAPLVAHAALAYPTGKLRSPLEVAVVAFSYCGAILLLGLLPTAVFDPKATGCFECPPNLVLVEGDGGLFDTFNRYGLRVGIGWLAALGVLLLWRLIRSSHAAAVVFPVLVPATAYLALVAWDFQHSLAGGILGNDSFDERLWRYEAAALAAFALGIGLTLLRERQARASVARYVVELGQMPRPGAVRDALAEALGDPALELAYRRPETGAYVDAAGRSTEVDRGSGRAVTPLVRGETPIAVLVHDERLLDQFGLVEEVLTAARLAVENEQLQAEVRARLEELRASRARIVETGDAERRRLERDLHDGAQQSLLALSYDLRVVRAGTRADGDQEVAALLASASDEAQSALDQLRELAHGIYPAILTEAGLGAALASLADTAPLVVELGEVPQERYAAPVETAAYVTVAEAIEDAEERGATFVGVTVRRDDGRLRVTVEDDGPAHSSELVHLSDRIGALGGSVEVGQTMVRAEIPCA
jgi:signal transduction histidine kinase